MPTFQNLRKGSPFPGVLGLPGRRFGASRGNVAGVLTVGSRPFRSPPFSTSALWLTGATKDSAGAALPGCTVDLFITRTDALVATTLSDGSGNYSFQILVSGPFYLVAYLAGAPDVAGTTVNTLTGA